MLREFGLVVLLFTAYKIGRLFAAGHRSEALRHAQQVWSLERWLHLPSEAAVQHWVVDVARIPHLATTYYAAVHFPATIACLVWLYLRHRTLYRRTRTTLALLTGAALVIHVLYPLAPPRMLAPQGMIDLSALYGPQVYGNPATDTLSNQYAAMPSLHVGWAMVVAGALIAGGRTRWRFLWLLHPAMTLAVVVATGHHFWSDAIVAAVLLAAIHLRPVHKPRGHGPALAVGGSETRGGVRTVAVRGAVHPMRLRTFASRRSARPVSRTAERTRS